jgi:hypothetical protein
MGRSDCCQDRNYGLEVFAGDDSCGKWPEGKKDGWVEFKCPGYADWKS